MGQASTAMVRLRDIVSKISSATAQHLSLERRKLADVLDG